MSASAFPAALAALHEKLPSEHTDSKHDLAHKRRQYRAPKDVTLLLCADVLSRGKGKLGTLGSQRGCLKLHRQG